MNLDYCLCQAYWWVAKLFDELKYCLFSFILSFIVKRKIVIVKILGNEWMSSSLSVSIQISSWRHACLSLGSLLRLICFFGNLFPIILWFMSHIYGFWTCHVYKLIYLLSRKQWQESLLLHREFESEIYIFLKLESIDYLSFTHIFNGISFGTFVHFTDHFL